MTIKFSAFKYIVYLFASCLLLLNSVSTYAVPANQISNSVTASSPTYDSVAGNNSATTNDRMCYQADLESTSVTDGVTTTQPGDTPVFTSTVTNLGPSRVTSLFVYFYTAEPYLDRTNVTPTTSEGSISYVGFYFTSIYHVKRYLITGVALDPGETITNTFSGTVVLPDAVDGQSYLTQVAYLVDGPDFDECAIVDTNSANLYARDFNTMQTVADLDIVKTSTGGADSSTSTIGTVFAGSTISYTLAVSNNGPSEAAGTITVTDTWPSQISPTDQGGGNYTSSSGWTCSFSAPTMTCTNTNSLANGSSSNIVIAGTVNQSY